EGLDRVFPDARGPRGTAWGTAIGRAVAELGYRGAIVIGFSRFATYAIARAAASAVPLGQLDIDAKLREALGRLGVTRVGEMVRLPGGGILERFGSDAHRLYQLAAGESWEPLVPVAPPEAPDERALLDDEEDDVERLVFASKPPIERLLARL